MAIGNPINLTSNVEGKSISVSATAGQTQFTVTGGYRINQISVYRNGVRLVDGRDFTATDGSIVTLLSAASVDDVVEFQVFDDFRVSDALNVNSGGTVNGDVTVNGALTVSSTFTGTATTAQGLTGSPDIAVTNITAGIITATTFSGNGSALTGVASTDNIITGTAATFTSDVNIADSIIHVGDTNTKIRFPAADTFTAETAGSERLRITSSGRVVVGNDTERNNYDNGSVTSNLLHVERTAASGNAGISICANAETAADAGAIIYMGRTSANSNGGNTIVEHNDLIGRISFQGADGSELVEAACIRVDVDGTPGANDMPGRIEFHTTSDGSAGATERLRIDSTGIIQVKGDGGNNNKIYGYDGASLAWIVGNNNSDDTELNNFRSGNLLLKTNGTEAARFDSSQRLLIGSTSARANTFNASAAPQVQVEGTNANLASIGIFCSANDTDGGRLLLAHQRSGGVGGNTIVNNNDQTGSITFQGNDGNEFVESAAIKAEIDGTPGANDMPGRLTFHTTADGAASPTERLRLDSSGRLLIGADTSTLAGTIQAKTQIVSSDFNAALAIRRNQNSDGAPALIFFKNRGTSNSSNTVVQDDDGLGNIRFYGNDGTDFAEGAAISARVDGTPGSNDMPGALEFKTSADGAESPVVKFTIHSTGNCTVNDGDLVIGTNGHGIDFSADGNAGGMTSELLDDYEEGTFTPTANNFTVSGTSTLTGQYIKIGRQVTVGIKFANTGTIAHATSAFIGGLPFSMASGTEANGLIGMLDNANSTAFNSNKSGTQCKLDGEGGSRFFPGSFTTTSSGGQLLFGGTYISAS